MPSGLVELGALFGLLGPDLQALLLAWARALPVVILVPAFGLAAVAPPIRIALAVAMAAAVAPALHGLDASGPFWLALGREAASAVPLALATAAILWAAVMAGGLVDNLRGARESLELPLLDEPGPPLSALLGLLVAVAFLEVGGAARLCSALAEPRLHATWAIAAERLAQAVGIAVAIAAPLAVGSIVVEVVAGLVARAASPAYVIALVAPVRSVSILLLVWLVLDRVVELLVVLSSGAVAG